ncbi:MAG: hypothetical protein RIS47_104 [Bacteroidota bacterium]|jgi:aspartyl aminopeptidase
MTTTDFEISTQLLDFINNSPSQYHATENSAIYLTKHGFTELQFYAKWNLIPCGKYFVRRNMSTLVAFVVGTEPLAEQGFRIVASHTDSPGFKVKPQPDQFTNSHYHKLNTEVYGGPIFSTWLDRPLSLAGRVSLRSANPLTPNNKLLRIAHPLLVIPNLAIHLNRDINDGKSFNAQIDMLPILGQIGDQFAHRSLSRIIADELNVAATDVIDFDLHLYDTQPGSIVGANSEFISSARLDNLAMVHASLLALATSTPAKATNLISLFDNEEIGSQTKQGAGAPILKQIMQRIVSNLGGSDEDYFRALHHSFMISADMAHAVHPNFPEKHDPNLRPEINKGPVVKVHAGQKYTTDSDSSAVYEMICQEAEIPYQKFVNRSDLRGGSTLGCISATHVDIRSVDIGNPMLSMHSIRELAGTSDHKYIVKSFECLFKI